MIRCKLKLIGCQANEAGDLQDFASAIRDHTSLKVLDLSDSKFTPAGLSHVLCGLKDSSSIKEIVLKGILGDENAERSCRDDKRKHQLHKAVTSRQ